jgi:hypothetical protein
MKHLKTAEPAEEPESGLEHGKPQQFSSKDQPVSSHAQPTLTQVAKQLHSVLQNASRESNCNLSESTYVRPHLVRKLLLRRCYSRRPPSQELSWQDFLGLQLPDQSQFLAHLPPAARNVQLLQTLFKCHPLLLTCFLCLATPALKKRPSLLTYLDPDEVGQLMDAYVACYGFPPSLERLFTWKPAEPSSEEEGSATESESRHSQPVHPTALTQEPPN